MCCLWNMYFSTASQAPCEHVSFEPFSVATKERPVLYLVDSHGYFHPTKRWKPITSIAASYSTIQVFYWRQETTKKHWGKPVLVCISTSRIPFMSFHFLWASLIWCFLCQVLAMKPEARSKWLAKAVQQAHPQAISASRCHCPGKMTVLKRRRMDACRPSPSMKSLHMRSLPKTSVKKLASVCTWLSWYAVAVFVPLKIIEIRHTTPPKLLHWLGHVSSKDLVTLPELAWRGPCWVWIGIRARYRVLHANLSLFSTKQQKFLEKECALAKQQPVRSVAYLLNF